MLKRKNDKEKLLSWVAESKSTLLELDADSDEAKSLAEVIRRLEDGLLDPDAIEGTGLGVVNLDHLKETITELEISHPRVTGIMNDLMVTLSAMGI